MKHPGLVTNPSLILFLVLASGSVIPLLAEENRILGRVLERSEHPVPLGNVLVGLVLEDGTRRDSTLTDEGGNYTVGANRHYKVFHIVCEKDGYFAGYTPFLKNELSPQLVADIALYPAQQRPEVKSALTNLATQSVALFTDARQLDLALSNLEKLEKLYPSEMADLQRRSPKLQRDVLVLRRLPTVYAKFEPKVIRATQRWTDSYQIKFTSAAKRELLQNARIGFSDFAFRNPETAENLDDQKLDTSVSLYLNALKWQRNKLSGDLDHYLSLQLEQGGIVRRNYFSPFAQIEVTGLAEGVVPPAVFVDGAEVATGEQRVLLTPGEHRIEVKAEGYAPYSVTETLNAGDFRSLLYRVGTH